MPCAAFFDIDHTIIAGDSGMLFARYLLRRGHLKRRDLLRPLYYTLLHRLNALDIDVLFARYTESIRGHAHAEMQALCEAWFVECLRPAIYPSMVAAIAAHRQAGHVIALLSSVTNYVAEPLGRELGVEHLLVNRLLIGDGRLTGDAVRPLCYGDGKLFWAQRFATERGIDLGQSYFYSDSASDLPVLEAVGHPRPVNPDWRLRRHARRRRWPVVVLDGTAAAVPLAMAEVP